MVQEFRHHHSRERGSHQSLGWLNLAAGGLVGGSFLLWTVPPFFLAKNQISQLWIQGLSLVGAIAGSSIGLVVGYRLKRIEPILQAQEQQQDEDFVHWLAANRYYLESLRENAVESALAEQMAPGGEAPPMDPRLHYQSPSSPEGPHPQAAMAMMVPYQSPVPLNFSDLTQVGPRPQAEPVPAMPLYSPLAPQSAPETERPDQLTDELSAWRHHHSQSDEVMPSDKVTPLFGKGMGKGSPSKTNPKPLAKPPLAPVPAPTLELKLNPDIHTEIHQPAPKPIEIPLGLRLSGPPDPQPFLTPDENDSRVRRLWDQLNAPGCEWLLQLLLTKPLLIWGEQCSGKTSFAGFLALLRIIFFGHRVSVSDPHSHQNTWPGPFEVYGGEYNYNQINSRLVAYYQRLKTGSVPHTSIWDEVTQYHENCDPQLAGRFLKSILSDVRKPPEFPILLSHGNTLSALGGGRGGIKAMQARGLVEVNLRATRDHLGNLRPALRGHVTGLDIDEQGKPSTQPLALESWMQPNYLLELFPELIFGGFTTEGLGHCEETLIGQTRDRPSATF